MGIFIKGHRRPSGEEVEIEHKSESSVSCVLLANTPIDVSILGSHPLLWDGLEDDVWNENPLASIPLGLGLNFLFDGSDNTIAVIEDGTWAFSVVLLADTPDPDWHGKYDDSLFIQNRIIPASGISHQYLTTGVVMTLPIGASIDPRIITDVAASEQQSFTAGLMIVRLA